jgi:TolB-like protein
LAADVVGYSRLMEQDEAGTLSALKERRQSIFGPLVSKHQGRVVKVMGDGALVEFASAVHAVDCAVGLQREFARANEDLPESRRIVLRIGINVGDIMVEGTDLYGDGVNVAARLETLADPGAIFVSRNVYEQAKNKLVVGFDELGPQAVKNIAEPVYVYRVSDRHHPESPREPLPLPGKPSLAVLPFINISTDPDQEPFADGLTEDLITDLSRNAGLFVIARNSTFAYKGKSTDARRIASDLGVRYLLEGSIRRAAGRVRINAQLIDATTGGHLWAERFDRTSEDIFAVQDEVIAKIVEALVGQLAAPPARRRPANLEAYDLCVRARVLYLQSARETREARLLLERAIKLDPQYAEAHRWLAFNLWLSWCFWGEPRDPTQRRAVELAERAAALDPYDAGNRWVLGFVLAHDHRWAESEAEFAAALELDPNHADAWAMLTDLSVMANRPADAIEQSRKALRLNPHPPGWYYWMLGEALYAARDYEQAIETLKREETYRTESRRLLAASLAQAGRIDEARHEAELFLLSNPNFKIRKWAASQPFRDESMRQHFVEGLRKAGLPD